MILVLRYARSRGAAPAVVVLLALSAAGSWAGRWLASRPSLPADSARLPVTVALALAAAVVLGGTLHSPADELERTTPRPWAAWRAGHAATAALVAAAAVLPVLPAAMYGQQALVRNTVGLLGLTLFTATLLGPRLAWTLPLGCTATVYLAGSPGTGAGRMVWAFLLQPAGAAPATAVALGLPVAGLAAWAATARLPMR